LVAFVSQSLALPDLGCFANDMSRHLQKQKRRGRPRLFRIPLVPCRSSGGDHGNLVCATHEPGQKDDSGNPDHCLGRQAPAGFLNVFVHDVLFYPQKSARTAFSPFFPTRMMAGYDFGASLATAKMAKAWRRPHGSHAWKHDGFNKISLLSARTRKGFGKLYVEIVPPHTCPDRACETGNSS